MAADFRIALVAWLARADGAMVLHLADGIGTTVAGLAALTVDTRFAVTAVVVRGASLLQLD